MRGSTLATASVISRDRVALGAGVGWLREEFLVLDGVFSDAANKAIENAKSKIFQPDWLQVLEPDEIADSIRRIT